MKISCLMPTYNRASTPAGMQLLREAVGCFLSQDYLDKELLIGNDTPGQHLNCNHPQVRCLNHHQRFTTLGAKLAWMIEEAYGSLLCRWDDDDISLPHRLSFSAAALGDRMEWRPGNYWWYQNGKPHQVTEVAHAGNTHVMALWRYQVLDAIGGYPITTGNEDQQFNQRLVEADITPLRNDCLDQADIFYVYRWGVSDRHLSGQGGDSDTLQAHWNDIGRQPVAHGTFHIEPAEWQLPGQWVKQ